MPTAWISWHHTADPDRLVTWVESHDTYANQHESADIEDARIREGYVFLAARQYGTPLFFSRPAGSTRQNYWGNNRVGARGNDEFMNPEVIAVNHFRHAMQGQPEEVFVSENGALIEVARGNKGVALINISDKSESVDLATTLANGKYVDEVHGNEFVVKDGKITGEMQPLTSYIIYKK